MMIEFADKGVQDEYEALAYECDRLEEELSEVREKLRAIEENPDNEQL